MLALAYLPQARSVWCPDSAFPYPVVNSASQLSHTAMPAGIESKGRRQPEFVGGSIQPARVAVASHSERAPDQRWNAEKAVRAIRSDAPEILKARIAILAGRAGDEIDVSHHLCAIAAG
jgi:hypothetical protein